MPAAHRARSENPDHTSRLASRAGGAGLIVLLQLRQLGHALGLPPAQAGTSAFTPVIARPMISFWICEVPS